MQPSFSKIQCTSGDLQLAFGANLSAKIKVQYSSVIFQSLSGKFECRSGKLQYHSGERKSQSGKLQCRSGDRKSQSGKLKCRSGDRKS